MLDAGNDVFGEAARQVSVGSHESGEAESGVGHPADEGMVVGGSPSVGDSDGPFKAKIVGQGPEADDGYLEGHLAAEGVDARPDLVRWLISPLAGNFSLPLICSHFLPFGRVLAGGRVEIGARPGGGLGFMYSMVGGDVGVRKGANVSWWGVGTGPSADSGQARRETLRRAQGERMGLRRGERDSRFHGNDGLGRRNGPFDFPLRRAQDRLRANGGPFDKLRVSGAGWCAVR